MNKCKKGCITGRYSIEDIQGIPVPDTDDKRLISFTFLVICVPSFLL